MRVLIIDDEADILATIADQLSLHNIITDCAYGGEQGKTLALQNDYDVIILDVTMPRVSGLDVCLGLRQQGCTTPIIYLTARDTLEDKVRGFSNGGDDYLVKPFAMDELLCRVKALSQRVSKHSINTHIYGELTLNVTTMTIHRKEHALPLNKVQYKLLKYLILQAPKIVRKEQIEFEIWHDEPPDSDAFRSHLYQLRKVLDKPFSFAMLETVRGQGYRLIEK